MPLLRDEGEEENAPYRKAKGSASRLEVGGSMIYLMLFMIALALILAAVCSK